MLELDAHVFDVAAYILRKLGPISAMKLQKLVYYCQAWSLVWDGRPLFPEPIMAWTNGPVAPALFERHKGSFLVSRDQIGGDESALDDTALETIDIVLNSYGGMNAQQLSDLTHAEDPWVQARVGLSPDERGNREISLESMSEYYSSLPPEGDDAE